MRPNSPAERACTLRQATLSAAASIPPRLTIANPRSFARRSTSGAGQGLREEERGTGDASHENSAGSDTRGRDARSDERERTHSDGSTSRSRDSLCENQTSCDSSDRKMCAGTCSKAEEMTALLLGPR